MCSIQTAAGSYIINDMVMHCDVYDENSFYYVRRYQKEKKSIVVGAIPSSGSRDERYKHHRLTIKAWKLYSFRKNGVNVTVNHSVKRHKRDELKRNTTVLPSESIEHATLRPGDSIDGATVLVNDTVHDPEDILDVIELDLFIFKSVEIAQQVFAMNVMHVE